MIQMPISLEGGFSLVDWLIVLGTLMAITVLGHRLTGRIASLRDFYLGGRSLPWFAVSASIIATEISAVTFFAVPSMVWREGGSLEYLQIGLFSALIARMVVAFVLAPSYFQKEIFSPYDYMGERLGRSVRRMTTALFMLGGTLAQAARVYFTALIIEVLAFEELGAVSDVVGLPPIAIAIVCITAVALLWTWIGGVATVVWTDAMLFVLFIAGIGAILVTLHTSISGGLGAAWELADASGRLGLFDTKTSLTNPASFLTTPYGLLSVFVGASWGLVAPYGTDQMIAQRVLCCRSKGAAQLAVLGGYFSVVVVGLSFLVGIGLLGYYDTHSMSAGAAALVEAKPERILPIYVREVLPAGVRGLVLAAAFAAAISSLDSILAALGQTTQALRARWDGESKEEVGAGGEAAAGVRGGRLIVVGWAVVLGLVAILMQDVETHYADLIGLALGMSALIGGPLLAAFALSWITKDESRPLGADGFLWAAPLGVLTVTFAAFPGDAMYVRSWYAISALYLAWLLVGLPRRRQPYGAVQSLVFGFTLFLLTRVADVGDFDGRVLQWPWYVPVGSTVTFVFALVMDKHGSRQRSA